MPLIVLIGGARAGKSSVAQQMAEQSGDAMVLVATAESRDGEMRHRIEAHRQSRSHLWTTVEESLDLVGAIKGIDSESVVVVDCLTLWVSNLLEAERSDEAVLLLAREVVDAITKRTGTTVAVTNEVGLGIVPSNALARRYRDLLGAVNRIFVSGSGEANLVVAGRLLPLGSP